MIYDKEAFKKGRSAYTNGKSKSDNPYPKSTNKLDVPDRSWISWNDGYEYVKKNKLDESKVEEYWKKLSQESNKSLDQVERAWRTTRIELDKEGIAPNDPKYNSELMTRTKTKVMKESKFEQYIQYLNEQEEKYGRDLPSDKIDLIRQKEGIKYNTDKGHPTQIKGTEKTYQQLLNMIPEKLKAGIGLDYSAGRAHGTEFIRNQGHNIEAYEPYPNKDRLEHITYSGLGSLPKKKYDYIICSCVLNVVPKDIRDHIVQDIWNHLNKGGEAFITVRGKDVMSVKDPVILSYDNMEVIVRQTGAYQKGFTQKELVNYIKELLPKADIAGLGVSSASVRIIKK